MTFTDDEICYLKHEMGLIFNHSNFSDKELDGIENAVTEELAFGNDSKCEWILEKLLQR